MKTVDFSKQVHFYSPYNVLALYVDSGETVKFLCQDTYNDMLNGENCSTADMAGRTLNPLNGPVYVNGAMPGDTLKITIEDIHVTSSHATMVVNDDLVLKGLTPFVSDEEIFKIPLKDGFADVFGNMIELKPFPGCLGISPAEKISSMYPGTHGGNMDNKKLTEGSELFLPVAVPGALVTTGDIHAFQGDGEIVCGLEVAGEIILKLEVIKGKVEKWPILKTNERWYVITSCPTMEEASDEAVAAMERFILSRTTRYTPHQLMIVLSQLADIEVCQIVNPLITMRFGIDISAVDEVQF
ncbi:MAG TPA: hypothetical protein GXZ43_06575 [Clostridiaceae bacterium]|nr:hypothetical protein [Clostridiaceae bacterium]